MDESQTKLANALSKEIQARVKALPELKTQAIRAVRREFTKRLQKASPDLVLELALRLLKLNIFELRFVAYELVQNHRGALSGLNAKTLEELGKGIDSWVAVDCFSSYLAGPAWREGQIADEVIHRWAKSKDRWWRRAALVATVPLNIKARGGSGDARRTLEVCRSLINDRDDMVEKAMSWALRELAKRDPPSVRQFIKEHEEKLAPRVRREVGNKLATGLKNPKQRIK